MSLQEGDKDYRIKHYIYDIVRTAVDQANEIFRNYIRTRLGYEIYHIGYLTPKNIDITKEILKDKDLVESMILWCKKK